MRNGYIRIGWDEYGPTITEETDFNLGGKNVLNAFINRMQIGDIVLSCYSERTIDAVGVVKGEYEWHPELEDYCRVRKVKWIVKGINYDIFEMNHNTVMTLSTVYKLNVSVADVIRILNENNAGKIIAAESPKRYVFIIDEINRGNISKIFGELITLIEPTKRLGQPEAIKAKLPYSQEMFGVPDNVYIIGTMNTADRSIALIDTALRRRFNFIECQPDLKVLDGIEVEGILVSELLSKLNRRIEVLCDREHTIGHSYFLALKDNPTLNKLADIFAHNIIPLLQEYFYEDYEKIRLVLGDSHKDYDDQFIHKKQNDNGELFGGAEVDLDEIASYEINPSAFTNINAYRNV
jgi:5-methylcytosine-specific restriction protein B